MPGRPKDRGRESVRRQFRNVKPPPPSEMAEIKLEIPLDAGREILGGEVCYVQEMIPREAGREIGGVGQVKFLRVQADPVAELADIWTANNLPSEDIAKILQIAVEAFDDAGKALRWLEEPNIQTGNRPPVSLIGTPEGFAAIESVLRQIQYGVFG